MMQVASTSFSLSKSGFTLLIFEGRVLFFFTVIAVSSQSVKGGLGKAKVKAPGIGQA